MIVRDGIIVYNKNDMMPGSDEFHPGSDAKRTCCVRCPALDL